MDQRKAFEELEIKGAAEFAKILGWDVRKLSVYNERGKLPEPIGHVNSRPVWTMKQIDDYLNK